MSSSPARRFALFVGRLLLFTLVSPHTYAGLEFVKTVGSTQDCDVVLGGTDTTPINEALADGAVTLLIAVPELTGPIRARNQFVHLFGGYTTCAEALDNFLREELGRGRTTLRGPAQLPLISITADLAAVPRETSTRDRSANPFAATVSHFEITDGGAGGVLVEGAVEARISSSRIHNNRAEVGAGLRVRGALATVNVSESVIEENHASLDGGGIACSSTANVLVGFTSLISGNTAGEFGGGIDALDCRVEIRGNVVGNRAEGNGGGIHATTGSMIDVVGIDAPVLISGNVADADGNGDGSGGGVYVGDSHTVLRAENLHLKNNRAGLHGGGVMVEAGARARFQQVLEERCGQPDCSVIEGNQAGLASAAGQGAALYADGGHLEVLQTKVRGHGGRQRQALIYLEQPSSILDIESSLIHSNGGSDLGEVLRASNVQQLNVRHSTIAGNRVRNPVLVVENSPVSIEKSVVMRDQNARLIDYSDGASHAARFFTVLTDTPAEFSQIEAGDLTVSVEPAPPNLFIDPARGNYHIAPRPENLAKVRDREGGQMGFTRLTTDYAGRPRLQPAARIGPDVDNLSDIGPDEFRSPLDDLVFASSFDRAAGPVTFGDRLAGVFKHPRCTNCHTAVDDPESVNSRFDHSGLGLATCSGGCHAANGTPDFNLENWHAPTGLRLQGLSNRQLCALAKDSVLPRVFSAEDHLTEDPLILWAVVSGVLPNGASGGAGNFADVTDWRAYVEQWFADGARCN